MRAPIALADLNALSSTDIAAKLANVFEHSPWIAEQAAAARPFSGIVPLFAALTSALDAATPAQRLALLRAHPDLASRAERAAGLTADSAAEQGSVGLDRLSAKEQHAFARANQAYREKFGFPYIVCARRHTRDSILRHFERRLANDAPAEIAAAIREVSRIAALRLARLVTADDALPVNGQLSTHVLDIHRGTPAAGVTIELVELSRHGHDRTIARATTNADGRTDPPLIQYRPVPIGHYELRFAVGPYFAGRGVPVADPPFLDVVPIRFAVAEPEASLHVPLLVTPWSYSTYCGS
jgi:2-oxo-4-hydroxy-4-carboxy-5-ureidoimidazoline decarboxylase